MCIVEKTVASMSSLITLPASHVIISVHWNVGNDFVVKLVVTVWCSKPLVKAVFQWQIMRQMTEMPTIMSIFAVLNTGIFGKENNATVDIRLRPQCSIARITIQS